VVYVSELINVFIRLHKEYSPVFRIWILGFPEVFITDPDDIEVSKKIAFIYIVMLIFSILTKKVNFQKH
jgi:hypothetical protein